jgi:tetraacyldisaccharide 4'-kinase
MFILKILLFPFSVIYDAVTRLRNHLYTIGHKKSFQFETMVISVGNLNLGGSGKTPMIEYLIRLLKPMYKVAILSRGYGRRTRGLRFATENENAKTIGDEPFQLFKKFEDISVTVCEERAFAIPHILQHHPDTDVILLDDAFQHRSVRPHLSILLSEFKKPFYDDHLLPLGRLREARQGASRSDIVVITKCKEDVDEQSCSKIAMKVKKFSGEKPVFFSGLEYANPIPIGAHLFPLVNEVILVSGIADTTLFVTYAASRFKIIKHFKFSDHHDYSLQELKDIAEFYDQGKKPLVILTTEKDMVKLIDDRFKELVEGLPWFFLPVSTAFLNHGADFDRIIIRAIEDFRSKHP